MSRLEIKLTRKEARRQLEEFNRKLKKLPLHTPDFVIAEMTRQLPKAVKVLMFYDEMNRIRKLPKAQRKKWLDDYMAMESRRQAQRN